MIIIGASGLGREVLWVANRLNIKVKGFLDDNTDSPIDKKPILGPVNQIVIYENCQFIVAIANPSIRQKVVNYIDKSFNVSYLTLIDPSAQISLESVSVEPGTLISAGTVVTENVRIGKHCIINKNCSIGHDVFIDDFCTIAPLVGISGNVSLKAKVEVGMGACIRQGVTLNERSLLGMGSVLLQDLPENSVMVGNPAKLLRPNNS